MAAGAGSQIAKIFSASAHEWTGTFLAAGLIGLPATLHTFPGLVPDFLLKKWFPDTRDATPQENKSGQEMLERYGIFDAPARTKFFAYKYRPGEPNDVTIFGSFNNWRIMAPEPYLQSPDTPIKIAYNMKSMPENITPRSADKEMTRAQFDEIRREAMKTDLVLPFSESEQDVIWRGTAAAMKLNVERNVYSAGLAWLMMGIVISVPLRRLSFKKLPISPPRMSNLSIGMALTGMMVATHAAQRKIVDDICRDDTEVCEAALRQTAAEQAYNLARKESPAGKYMFWITSAGNDWLSNVSSLSRRYSLIAERRETIKIEKAQAEAAAAASASAAQAPN